MVELPPGGVHHLTVALNRADGPFRAQERGVLQQALLLVLAVRRRSVRAAALEGAPGASTLDVGAGESAFRVFVVGRRITAALASRLADVTTLLSFEAKPFIPGEGGPAPEPCSCTAWCGLPARIRWSEALTNRLPAAHADTLRRVFDNPQPKTATGPRFQAAFPKHVRNLLGLDSRPPGVAASRRDAGSDPAGELILERYRWVHLAAVLVVLTIHVSH